MKRTLFLLITFALVFTACSFSKKPQVVQKKQIEIPTNAPKWVYENTLKNHMVAPGVTKDLNEKELAFQKQKAMINAGHNLTKKIYVKTVNLYKAYLEKLNNPKIFEKDIKKFAEHIALKSLTHSKIKNNWISPENDLFVQVGVDSNIVAEQIQYSSKLLFGADKNLYHNFLSNRAKKDIITYLEK